MLRYTAMMKPAALFLLLPLVWASCGFAQPPAQPSSSAHGWQQSQITDTARSLTYTRFTLTGKFLAPPHDQAANRPALAVDCIPSTESHSHKGRLLATNLLVGSTLKIVYVEPEEIHGTSYYPKVVVRYRMDAAGDDEEKWAAGADKTSVSVPKDSLKKILRAHSVAITAVDDRGSQFAMQFSMPDATPVEDACNVDER
jgi:hypothetical protein